MRLRVKLILCFLLSTGSLVIVATSGIHLTNKLGSFIVQSNDDLDETLVRLRQYRAANLAMANTLGELHHQPNLANDASYTAEARQTIINARNSFAEARRALPRAHPLSDAINGLAEETFALFEQLLVVAGVTTEVEVIDELDADAQRNHDKLLTLVDLAVESELFRIREMGTANENTIKALEQLHYAVIALSLWSSYAIGVALASRLTQPIQDMLSAAREIADGNLDARVFHSSSDELGELADALNHMVSELEKTTVSREYLDRIIHSLPDALFVLDSHGRIRGLNKAAREFLGYSEEELVGRSFASLIAAPHNAWMPRDTADEPVPAFEFSELPLRTFEGEMLPAQVSAGTLFNRKGEVEGQICVAKDLRERLRLEAERDRYRAELARSEQLASLGTVAAIIAHKINQPLTVIQLFIEQCIRENDEKFQSDLIEDNLHECLEEVERATDTVKQVLRMSRQSELVERSPHPIAAAKDKVLRALRDEIREGGLHVEERGDWAGLFVESAAGELDSVFFFMIQNAVQAGRSCENPRLELSIERFDAMVEIRFQDTCGGIEEENLDQIFELFFTTKPVGEGTGLGLPIVKQIIHRLEGEIFVNSEVGTGTEFLLRLPLAAMIEEKNPIQAEGDREQSSEAAREHDDEKESVLR